MRGGPFPLAVLCLLLAAGCAHRAPARIPPVTETDVIRASGSSAPAPSAPAPPASPTAPPAPPPAVSAADKAYSAGEAEMKAGNFERALDMFAAAWKENPGHSGAAKDFPEALAALKNSGDEAFRQGRLEEAGRNWSAALRFFSHPAEKGKPLPFTKPELRGSIDRLSSVLMEKGLVDYRNGNIEGAIASWKSILAYDPSHEEAARSVRTATTQLENLKKLGPAK